MLYGFPLLTMNVLCHDQRAAVDAQTRLAETQSALDAEAEIMRGFLEVALVQHLGVAERLEECEQKLVVAEKTNDKQRANWLNRFMLQGLHSNMHLADVLQLREELQQIKEARSEAQLVRDDACRARDDACRARDDALRARDDALRATTTLFNAIVAGILALFLLSDRICFY